LKSSFPLTGAGINLPDLRSDSVRVCFTLAIPSSVALSKAVSSNLFREAVSSLINKDIVLSTSVRDPGVFAKTDAEPMAARSRR
jgi:hypothetical protein